MATITYNAPTGDDKVVTYMGVEMFSGIPVELDMNKPEHEALAAKAMGNMHFDLVMSDAEERQAKTKKDGSDEEQPPKRRPGRPSKIAPEDE